MDAHQKGELTEAAVLAELKRHGIPVLTPFGDNQRYDMVVETPAGELLTLQIKTGRLSNGVITFHTKSQHTNAEGNVYKYYDGEIDCFVVYVHELETLYLVYINEFDRRISLRVEDPDQPDPSINWADDYKFDARWPPSAHRIRSASHGRAPAVEPVGERLQERLVPFVQVDDKPYQFIACDDSGTQHRIRACSGSVVDGRIRFPTRDSDAIDVYCVHCSETEGIYLVTNDEFDQSISLRVDPPDQPDASINWADDYRFDERWPP